MPKNKNKRYNISHNIYHPKSWSWSIEILQKTGLIYNLNVHFNVHKTILATETKSTQYFNFIQEDWIITETDKNKRFPVACGFVSYFYVHSCK